MFVLLITSTPDQDSPPTPRRDEYSKAMPCSGGILSVFVLLFNDFNKPFTICDYIFTWFIHGSHKTAMNGNVEITVYECPDSLQVYTSGI